MIRSPVSLLVAALLLAGSWIALAQDKSPTAPTSAAAQDDSRFTFTRMDRRTLMRLDRRTGQVSHCRRRDGNWGCEAVADDRSAYEAEIARQAAKIATLEAELAKRPGASPTPPALTEPKPEVKSPKWPNDADVERAMRYLETIFRRFMTMIDKLRAEQEGGRT